jgi:metal-responsive CopG/Arc/MetJ family transcriptional regulator
MSVRKVAISLDPELYAAVKADAERKGTSVSSWMSDAAAEKLRQQAWDEYMASYEAEFGEITQADVDRAHWETLVERTDLRKSG